MVTRKSNAGAMNGPAPSPALIGSTVSPEKLLSAIRSSVWAIASGDCEAQIHSSIEAATQVIFQCVARAIGFMVMSSSWQNCGELLGSRCLDLVSRLLQFENPLDFHCEAPRQLEHAHRATRMLTEFRSPQLHKQVGSAVHDRELLIEARRRVHHTENLHHALYAVETAQRLLHRAQDIECGRAC